MLINPGVENLTCRRLSLGNSIIDRLSSQAILKVHILDHGNPSLCLLLSRTTSLDSKLRFQCPYYPLSIQLTIQRPAIAWEDYDDMIMQLWQTDVPIAQMVQQLTAVGLVARYFNFLLVSY
jgi:hypothetical protein